MATRTKPAEAMEKGLLEAIEVSDTEGALKLLKRSIKEGADPWKIHLSLFPVVQQVLNPPFINPHLPKMYNITRELVSYLSSDSVEALVTLEVTEYARRSKMSKIPKPPLPTQPVSFKRSKRPSEKKILGKLLYSWLRSCPRGGGRNLPGVFSS